MLWIDLSEILSNFSQEFSQHQVGYNDMKSKALKNLVVV